MKAETEKTLRDYSLLGVESRRAMEMGLVDAEWYQSPIPRDKMKALLVRKDGPAILDTLIWFGMIIGSASLVCVWWGSWIAIFPYIVYSVLYASTSDSRWHESGHGTAFKSDWMNNVLYEIASFMVFRQSTVWRWSHARHHSDTIIRGSDPEISVPRPPSIRKIFFTFLGISAMIPELKKLVVHAAGRIDPEVAIYVPASEYSKVIFKARVYISIFLSAIILCIVYKTILPLMLIGLPTLLGSWLMPVYGITQHAGLDENVLDHRLNSRTIYMNRVHRFLYWNMNYHIEHHMFPLVPYHALPRLHELMKDDCPKPYSSLFEAYKEIIPTILKQRKNPEYFIKRKLPESALYQQTPPKIKYIGDESTLKDGVIAVCSLTALAKGEVVRFDFAQKTYAIYRTETDQFFATDGICTHGNAHLSEGMIIGDKIECPKHNGRFNLADGSPNRAPVCTGLVTYPCFTYHGIIYLNITTENIHSLQEKKRFRVVSNRNLSTFIKELVLECIDTNTFNYEPGQYIQLAIPPHYIRFNEFNIDAPFREEWRKMDLFKHFSENRLQTRRNYSLATNPLNDKYLKFNVRISLPPEGKSVNAGSGSSYVFNLKEDDQVILEGPHGDFLIKSSDREMVYIGGGAGMAPLRSHLSYLLETLTSARKISFWYGTRSDAELFYDDYFLKLQNDYENFSFHIAFSDPDVINQKAGHQGFISDVLQREYLNKHRAPAEIEFYLCGPPQMIKATLNMLEQLAVPKENISYDEF